MRRKGEEKVAGGKLLRMEVDFSDKINWVRLTGDFFLHPEDSLYEIERALSGVSVDHEEHVIQEKLDILVKEKRIEMIGFSPLDVSRLLKKLLSKGGEQ